MSFKNPQLPLLAKYFATVDKYIVDYWQRHWPTSLAKAVVNYCKSIWHHHWQRYRLSLAKELTIILKYIYHQWQRHCQSFSMARLKTLAIILGKNITHNHWQRPRHKDDIFQFQESLASCVYGGLSHHGLSRLSAASSIIGTDFNDDFDDTSSKKFEEKNSSGELYSTPQSVSEIGQSFTPLSSSVPASVKTSGSLASNGTRKKKSSWKNTLYPTYKSRSIEFKKLFPELPPEERLVVGESPDSREM